jgi:hypothetical protein
MTTTNDTISDDLEDNTADFVKNQMQTLDTMTEAEVNEINTTLRDIVSTRSHSLSPLGDYSDSSYP